MMNYFNLQPLRIPGGWTVKQNQFSEYDPHRDGWEACHELVEDLLQLENRHLLIDLGWYPAMNPSGTYILYLVDQRNTNPFIQPLEYFESISKQNILSKLEYWMDVGHYQQYL